ncbi:uncharacterized protein [Dysidea avara]
MRYDSRNIGELNALEQAVEAITAHGGGDCPELGMVGILNALSLANPDSNVIVLTDASAKDADRQNEVIAEATRLRNTVHLFRTRSGCGASNPFASFLAVVNATRGFVVDSINDFESFASFIDAARGNVNVGKRRKRQTNCIPFSASLFTESIIILFTSSVAGTTITVTSPSGAVTTLSPSGTVSTYSNNSPETGEYMACSAESFDHSISATLNLDFFVEYHSNGSRILQPPAGTSVTALVTSSMIANISADQNVYLNLVLVDGRVFSYPLFHCGSLLSGIITIPSIEFEHQLEGFDTEGNDFITSVSTRTFTTIVAPFDVSIDGALIYNPGDTMTLECLVGGGSDLQYSWMRDDGLGTFPPGTVIDTNTLNIINLATGDTGTYTCTVSNDAGSSGDTVFVIVYDPVPNVTVPNDQTVGQSLLLGCSVTTLSNVTEVDIVWRIRDGLELSRIESVSVSSTTGYSNTFESSYNITLLSTDDDGRMYQCVAVVDGTEIVGDISLDVTVPPLSVDVVPFSIEGDMVGSHQEVHCTVGTVSGVELDSVMISWTRPGGDTITNDSRVTISPTTSSGNDYISTLQFAYLMEGDEGMYTCNVMILETSASDSVMIMDLTVPAPHSTIVTAPSSQIVGQSLVLDCSVNAVRGIVSRVDIVWSSEGSDIETVTDISSTILSDNSALYTATLTISLLSTTDEDREYQCRVVINTTPPVMDNGAVTLNVTVPTPDVSIVPFGPITGDMVGSPQDIHCTVGTVDGVEFSTVLISWTRPGGDTITNDSRVTISPTTSSGNDYISTLQFAYLMEGDEGMYTCNVMILETSASNSIEIVNLIIPTPVSISVMSPATQIVGQSLMLECNAVSVRGITSRIDVVWSSDGTVLQTDEGVNLTDRTPTTTSLTNTYLISPLSTSDEDRTYQCEMIINTTPPIITASNVTLDVTVPTPTITITPSSPIQGAMVGSPQDIQCTAGTVDGVEFSTVLISWTGSGGDTITNDSRVTISPTTSSGNDYISTLQFAYLMEGDEGMYTCNVMILDATASETVEIQSLIVPMPTVSVVASSDQIVGQLLMLECNVTTVMGITSGADIVWSTDGSEIKRVPRANSTMYTSIFIIVLLGTVKDGRTYQCEAVINSSPPATSTNDITLDVIVPAPTITVTPSGPIEGAMVGSPQDIQCTVGTVDGVQPHLVLISWTGPRGDTITNDSRVTISPTTSSGNDYISTLQFAYLMEGDEGMYTCNVMILETSASDSVVLGDLTVPGPDEFNVTALDNHTVGQSLTLQCNVATVMGITSRVDIVWSSNGVELERITGVVANDSIHTLPVYITTYTLQVTTEDDDKTYQCEIVINTTPMVTASDSITLDVFVPAPRITIVPFGPLQGGTVGSSEEIHCTANTVDGVKMDAVTISWTGPGGDTITNDNRVTISPTISSGNDYISTLRFARLMEGDEGIYVCNVMILDTTGLDYINMSNITASARVGATGDDDDDVNGITVTFIVLFVVVAVLCIIFIAIIIFFVIKWKSGNNIEKNAHSVELQQVAQTSTIQENQYSEMHRPQNGVAKEPAPPGKEADYTVHMTMDDDN